MRRPVIRACDPWVMSRVLGDLRHRTTARQRHADLLIQFSGSLSTSVEIHPESGVPVTNLVTRSPRGQNAAQPVNILTGRPVTGVHFAAMASASIPGLPVRPEAFDALAARSTAEASTLSAGAGWLTGNQNADRRRHRVATVGLRRQRMLSVQRGDDAAPRPTATSSGFDTSIG
jgi:hypothetical protein